MVGFDQYIAELFDVDRVQVRAVVDYGRQVTA
jgi:hypothetical protein